MPDTVIRDDDMRKEITTFLQDEISKVREDGERASMETHWKKWRRQAQAKPEQDEKTYPWEKASNVVPPLTATNTNGIYASLKSSFSARKPFWTVEYDSADDKPKALALEKYLDIITESAQHLNMKAKNNEIFYDLALMGNKFVKVPWEVDYWSFKRRDPSGNTVQVSKVVHDSPTIFPIRHEDFLMRPYLTDIQRAPWVGHVHHYMWHELKQREAQGVFQGVDAIVEQSNPEMSESLREELSRRGIDPDTRYGDAKVRVYDVCPIYLFWDVDGDGIPEDICVWIEPNTGTIVREDFNDLGIRDIVNVPYLLLPDQLYAMGVGWMTESLQDEIEALHNMRIDGTHLSMLQMYITRRGCGIGPKEEFRPLKNIQVDNPSGDFIPIKFPDISPSTIQAEMLAKEYSDRFTGASDYMMGVENRNIGTRATATGTMFLAQQGNRIFQAIMENVEEAYSEIPKIVTFQLIRNAARVDLSLLPSDMQAPMQEVLSMNLEDVPSAFKFRVKTTEIDKTEEARKQNTLTLVQLYQMYGQSVFSLLPQVYNNQVPQPIKEVALKFFLGSTTLMEKIFKFFGEVNTNEYLPYVKDLEMMVGAIEQMKTARLGGASDVRANGGAMASGPAGGGGPSPNQGGGTLVERSGVALGEEAPRGPATAGPEQGPG